MKANRKFINDEEAVSAVIGVILMVAITVAIAATVYVYVSGMLSPTPDSAPSIAWTVDRAANTATITSGSAGDAYATLTSPNLVLKDSGGVDRYIKSDYHLTTGTSDLQTDDIAAGYILYLEDGETYQLIWVPTDKLIGEIVT